MRKHWRPLSYAARLFIKVLQPSARLFIKVILQFVSPLLLMTRSASHLHRKKLAFGLFFRCRLPRWGLGRLGGVILAAAKKKAGLRPAGRLTPPDFLPLLGVSWVGSLFFEFGCFGTKKRACGSPSG